MILPISTLLSIFAFFTQLTYQSQDTTIISGSIMVDKQQVLIHIIDPVNQRIKMFDSTMLVYYPEENRAFDIQFQNNIVDYIDTSLPLQNHLTQEIINQLDLKLYHQTKSGDTTKITYVPESRKTRHPIITTEEINGDIIKMSIAKSYLETIILKSIKYYILGDVKYMKKYVTEYIVDGMTINSSEYNFEEIRVPNKADRETMEFYIPNNIKIEFRSFKQER